MELFDFDDIVIQPSVLSPIRTRKVINARYGDGMLPLLTAPMDTVIDQKNFKLFADNGILPVLPRIKNPNEEWIDTGMFLSYSLEDFERIFLSSTPRVPEDVSMMVLIDVANGHMEDLYRAAKNAKLKYGKSMTLMVGNVANPETFVSYCRAGVDYVRIGIGNGGGCLTTVQTGIGYPMASLITECYQLRSLMDTQSKRTKIVADGGFKKYSDIIKALALGADYVMLGSILNKCLESCGETTHETDTLIKEDVKIDQYGKWALELFNEGVPLYKVFRGMSTKDVQKAWGKSELTTSEGVVKRHQVEYTINGWTHNFESYLKSAMSYTASKTLHDFIGRVRYNKITMNSFNRFNK